MLSLGSQYNKIFYISILINEITKKSISKINWYNWEFTLYFNIQEIPYYPGLIHEDLGYTISIE